MTRDAGSDERCADSGSNPAVRTFELARLQREVARRHNKRSGRRLHLLLELHVLPRHQLEESRRPTRKRVHFHFHLAAAPRRAALHRIGARAHATRAWRGRMRRPLATTLAACRATPPRALHSCAAIGIRVCTSAAALHRVITTAGRAVGHAVKRQHAAPPLAAA